MSADPTIASPDRPVAPTRSGRRAVAAAILVVVVGWSVSGLGVSLDRLLGAPGDAWDIFRRMVPPAFAEASERGVVGKVLESVHIAWIGTLIGATLSLPLAFLAAENVAPAAVRIPVRQLFNVIRAVPELILAVILIPITGLGPWAGALAIGIHSVGTLGKWATETIEGVDTGPLEAVAATGGRWVSGMRWGVVPQILPVVTSQWLFRFEINVRASAVLGMIGAGGVGSELVSQLVFRNFPAVGAVLLMTIAVVLSIDTASAAVRRRIIRGAATSSGIDSDEDRNAAVLADLTGLGR
ncbi:MAG: phosphonate ABC transporter, permease protein PhnE [Acidimicrobiales bacterium]|nr:phosphonate ABC transporter, permease protein PhnE [Acidimicrobiales bacterium]